MGQNADFRDRMVDLLVGSVIFSIYRRCNQRLQQYFMPYYILCGGYCSLRLQCHPLYYPLKYTFGLEQIFVGFSGMRSN